MIEIGEYTVFLSRGSYAVLACVIQGIAPYSLRKKFDVILHDIHQQYGALLMNFAGDSAPLAVTEPDLQACLLAERKQLDKTDFSPKYILAPLMLICAILAYWGYDNWQFEQRATDYVRLLQHNQSIVITQQNYHHGQLLINGLYDPLSEHPDTLIAQSRLQADELSVKLIIWDIAGENSLKKISQTYLRGAAGFLLVIDGTRMNTLDSALDMKHGIGELLGDIPFVILPNKCDLTTQWELTAAHIERLNTPQEQLFFTSAKSGEQVEAAFNALSYVLTL